MTETIIAILVVVWGSASVVSERRRAEVITFKTAWATARAAMIAADTVESASWTTLRARNSWIGRATLWGKKIVSVKCEDNGGARCSDSQGGKERDGRVLPGEGRQDGGVHEIGDHVVPNHGCLAADLESVQDKRPNKEGPGGGMRVSITLLSRLTRLT